MKVPYTAAHGAIRFSFSRENGDADVDRVLEAMPGIIENLRSLSPFWKTKDRPADAAFNPTYA